MLAKQYRELADECLAGAKTARTDKERRTFLQMAEAWLRAAMLADQRAAARPVNRSEQPQ
jgi:hypothetical protein